MLTRVPGAGVAAVPFTVWSPKFGTPCARMQAANLSDAPSGLELAVVLGVLDDPQAATAMMQEMVARRSVRT